MVQQAIFRYPLADLKPCAYDKELAEWKGLHGNDLELRVFVDLVMSPDQIAKE
jgi:hypothetical protein